MKKSAHLVRLGLLLVVGGLLYLNHEHGIFRAVTLYYQDQLAQTCQAEYTELLRKIRNESQFSQYADQLQTHTQSCGRLLGSMKAMEQLPQSTKEYLLDRVGTSWKKISQQNGVEMRRIMAMKGGEALLFPERFPSVSEELLAQPAQPDLDYYRQSAQPIIASAQRLMDYYNGSGEEQDIAHQLIQRVIAADQQYAPAYVALARYVLATTNTMGRRYRNNGLERGKALIDKAMALDGNLAAAYSLLGHWHIQRFDFSAAQSALDRARTLDANDPWVEVNQGRLYEKQLPNDAANSVRHYKMAALNGALPALPRAVAYAELAESECKKGAVDTAKQYYSEMVALQPNISWARGNLIPRILFDCSDLAWAEQVSKETLAQLDYPVAREDYGWVQFARAAKLQAAGQQQEALQVWQRALAFADNYQEFYIRAAEFSNHDLFADIYRQLPHFGEVTATGRAHRGKTMLHLAINAQRPTNVRWLIDQGMAIDTRDDMGHTPLHYAAQTGQIKVMQWLTERGADVNDVSGPSGLSPLMQAIEFKQSDAALWLMNNGADINYRMQAGVTPLGHAVSTGSLSIAAALLKRGADPSVRLYDQYTLQQAAVELNNYAMLALLKQYPGTE
ncbi:MULTISPECIES: ankyrin repeat domain-containing protein [unclassified Ketobacter]|uniref:ankyrin repeat domain-containing protein n=1 Tax=unclassified Ketobacter TaxID=2639109 RepID=UPI000F0D7E80|nr:MULTISPECIES: ankyrin repeat domain-containing protein [unclassified Ketobacter]RLT87399.1 MAG: hypothetical protein D9N13_23525 [Ketobacter sp. GenoA1]RLT94275.1 MAG: hypothetical protein D9N15_17735 [Ketobacter sp.]